MPHLERKVRFSIRTKIIAVISALVILSLGLYLFVALSLFNRDKSAYVFETTLTTADTVGSQVQTFLGRVLKDSLSIYNLVVDRKFEPDRERSAATFEEAFGLAPAAKTATALGERILALEHQTARDPSGAPTAGRIELLKLYVAQAQGLRREEAARAKPGRPPDFAASREVFGKALALFEADREDSEGGAKVVDADYLFASAEALQGVQRNDEALERLSRFVDRYKHDPRIRVANFALAELQYLRRQVSKAAESYRRAMAMKDRRKATFASYKLAWCLAASGQSAAAAAQLERVTKEATGLSASFQKILADDHAYFVSENVAGHDASANGATTLLESRRLLRSLFYGDPDIVEFSVYEREKTRPVRLLRLVNKDYLNESNLNEAYLTRVDEERPLRFNLTSPEKPLLQNSSLKGGMGLISLVRQDPLSGRHLVVRFRMDRFLAAFTQNKVYETFLINLQGDLYAHPDGKKLVADVNMLEEPYVRDVVKSGQKSGVREFKNRQGDGVIVAFADVGLFNLVVFSEIKTDKAFLAAKVLTVRSLYFGIFFIAMAMIIGIAFAKTLTTPIDKLFKGTKVIAEGNFKTKVYIKGNDEIGILADSFNFMAGRIVDLLEQEKDKVRLEAEVKVAKLVQDSFFPASRLSLGGIELASFYTPAAECGGDWWGVVRAGKKTLLLIGDATGHGVPAALITATAASCTTTVEELGKLHPDLLESPARVLGLLNKAVYGAAQGKILMTFFVCLIDPDAMTVTYSNASHNPPFLYKFQEKEPDKKDLKPLMDAVAYRLGHKPDTVYSEASAPLAESDVIVFFTDGFIECMNPEKEEYGNRKFIKSILKNVKGGSEEIRDTIIQSAMEFYGKQPLADDLTMVVAKITPKAASGEVAA